jgi:hypothetical protein
MGLKYEICEIVKAEQAICLCLAVKKKKKWLRISMQKYDNIWLWWGCSDERSERLYEITSL